MLKVDENNNITLTKGDSLIFTVDLFSDEEHTVPYVPAETDTLRFACSKNYVGEAGYKLLIEKPIALDTLLVNVPASETDVLFNGLYRYDVELTHVDGIVDTVISADLIITGEAK